MIKEEFIEWIYNLPLQTLTDELKDDIVEKIEELNQNKLIELLENQIMDLTMMSKIELGDDVIQEIKRLKGLLNQNKDE